MKVLAVCGSARKKGNTAMLLESALEGAKRKGAETELVRLYSLRFTGCVSCFECKKIGGKSYGRCAVKDDLREVLDKVLEADALILGTPVYFGGETGETRSFLERLLFPYATYTPDYQCIFPKKTPTALFYTMNVDADGVRSFGYEAMMERTRGYMERIFGACELFYATDTWQFDDYSKYLSTRWDADAKARRRREVFPLELEKAAKIGEKLAQGWTD